MSFLKRAQYVSASELRFRCRERARVGAEAIAFASGRALWTRERLRSNLLPLSSEINRARSALRSRDWSLAHAALRAHFLNRAPRFLIDPRRHQAIASAILQHRPSAHQEAGARANRLIDGRHDVLGYRDLSWSTEDHTIDWHWDPVHQLRAPLRFWSRVPYLDPRSGDHKIIWEVNRHQHWLALGRAAWLTGDQRFAAAFQKELASWLIANPPLTGVNWASMLELALRSISWIWALNFFVPFQDDLDDPWLVDLLLALDRQLDHVSRHLSQYFSPNTHLLGEGLALYVAGRVLPELKSAPRWERLGRAILVREAHAQVHPDGGHAELSAHYHRYALDFYLLALAVARRTADPVAATFEDVTSRLASFCRALADDDGKLPTIGDDDGGLLFPMCGRPAADAADSLSLAASLLDRPDLAVGDPPEEVLWMLGGDPSRLRQPATNGIPPSHLFPDSGYAVLRSSAGHAVLDAGRHGFLNGGHAHADSLSLVLSVHGCPLLIDPGTGTYTSDAQLRNRLRSTRMHNTVVLDGRPQSIPADPFHWRSSANATVTLWRTVADFDVIEAQHDGYLPDTHRRAVLRDPDGLWLVADHVLGGGSHRIDAHWHVAPSWTAASTEADGVRLAHGDRLWAAIASTAGELTDFRGDAGGLGWCAPVYGQLLPSLTFRFSQTAQSPSSIVTAVGAAQSPVELALASTPVLTRVEDSWHRAAVIGTHGEDRFVALFATLRDPLPFRHSGKDVPLRREVQRVTGEGGQFVTDARIALLRLSASGEPLSLVLVDATAASWTGRGGFNLGPLASAEDLHLNRTELRRLGRGIEHSMAGNVGSPICAE
jgi:hypothetical protein